MQYMIISRVVYDSRLRGYSVMTRALTYTDLFKQSQSHTTLAHRPDITTTTTYTIIAQIIVSFIVSLSCTARRGHMIIADSAKAVHGRWYITQLMHRVVYVRYRVKITVEKTKYQ